MKLGNVYVANDRSPRVVVDTFTLNSVPVVSGVPQGSVLETVLFVLFNNDLLSIVQSKTHLFADDSIVFREVASCDAKYSKRI